MHEKRSEQSPNLELTYDCLALLKEWGADLAITARILGFPQSARNRQIRKHYAGLVLPDNEEILGRAKIVVLIGDALRTTYPSSQQMRSLWMNTPHKRFDGLTPLQKIGQGDASALEAVLVLVDCAYGWQLNK